MQLRWIKNSLIDIGKNNEWDITGDIPRATFTAIQIFAHDLGVHRRMAFSGRYMLYETLLNIIRVIYILILTYLQFFR